MKTGYQPPLRRQALRALLTGLALAGSPFLFHLPVWIGLFFLGQLLLLAARTHLRFKPLPKRILLPAAMLGLGAVWLQFHTLLGLGAGSALLLIMLGFKTLEIRSHRDAMLALFLGYFVVITGFLFNQSLHYLPYLLVTAFVLTVALHQLNDLRGNQPLRQQIGSTLFMFALAIPVMLVLFVVFPRLSSPLWALPQASQARAGMSNSMAPGDIAQLLRSSEPAFRVSFADGEPPPKHLRYWRGPVLSRFDGRRWSRARLPKAATPTAIDIHGGTQQYTLTLEPHHRHWIFPLDMPVKAPDGTVLTAEYELSSDKPVNEIMQLQIVSATDYQLPDSPDTPTLHLALDLPNHAAPRTRQLARQLRAKAGTTEDYVRQVLDYFRHEPFRYTLQPQPLSGDPTDDFLLNTREGFCEHYASSFVVLMRAAGIPARVVTGYLGGDWNNTANYLLVRQSDAHAWAEVWLEDRGWVRVDPTSAIAPERIENNILDALDDTRALPIMTRFSFLNRLALQWDTLNYYWTLWVVGYDSDRQNRLLDRLGLGLQSWGKTLFSLLLGILLVVLVWAFVFALRQWRQRPDPVAAGYQQFTRKLARKGLPRQPHEAPLHYAERVIESRPDLRNAVRTIINSYARLRYGRQPHPEAITRFQETVKNFRP